jgi:malate dehydrogenase (oxaloacetate-decarboxylating)(NADP+)
VSLKSRAIPQGIDLLHDPLLNKGTAFTESERDRFHLRGLLPPRVFTLEEQQQRIMENFDRKDSDLERYIYLVALQDRNETLFYRTLVDHIERMLPIIYTPTVGEACRLFGHIFRRPRGLYVSARDRGRMVELLRNWPVQDVRVIVVTDGERILGLGDLGAHGMGIPIGKLSLYTACAGILPQQCLPIMLDVGTENELLLQDPLYIGVQQHRLRGDEYATLVEEFVTAVQEVFPAALIQFEDFATTNALNLLQRYRNRVCAFNDDIQGTAAVVAAALLTASRVTGLPFEQQRVVFLGAGAAATGIAELIVTLMMEGGVSPVEARSRCWLVDTGGLLVATDLNLGPHQRRYAQATDKQPDLLSTIRAARPTTLIGVSGQAGGFSTAVLRTMAEINPRPIILALSNPTSHSECTAEQAYQVSDGRAIFASGSPFAPVRLAGVTLVPAQANNAYIFPGLGLGVVLSGATRVTDGMFTAAARRLTAVVSTKDLDRGTLLPSLTGIREVSVAIASAVMEVARKEGLSTLPLPRELEEYVRASMYRPEYAPYI